MSRVVVLGGGPAGLYAALMLARRGVPVTLLEREGGVGGLTAGTEIAGIPVDYGSHRLHPSTDPVILDDLRSILGDDLQLRRRNGRIRMGDVWISFPLSAGEMLKRLSPRTVTSLGLDAFRATLTPTTSETFADVVTTGLGKTMGDLFYFPYARKIWGLEPDRLSGEQARRRISADSPWKLARKAMTASGTGRHFFYPRRGFGQIAARLGDAAVAAGAEIRTGTTVTSVSDTTGRFAVGTTSGNVDASLVLSTIPITVLARFLDPPDDVVAGLDLLRYRAMVLVYLVVPTGRWTVFDAHYFPGADVPFTRISEPKNYRSGDDTEDRTVLCVEIPCDPDDVVWTSADRDLIATVRQGVADVGLPDPGERGEVRRIKNAYPVYPVGAEAAFSRVALWLDQHRNLVSFGRQGLFAHDNTHHALLMARDAVDCISDDLSFDPVAWDRARERFASHVVED